MTLRRIHQNLHSIKAQNRKGVFQNVKSNEASMYDEEEPPRPKILVDLPLKWGNSRIQQDIRKGGLKASTARQSRRNGGVRNETVQYTPLSSSRNSHVNRITVTSSHNQSRQIQQLFVPERNRICGKNKFGKVKDSSKIQTSSFNSYCKKSLSLSCHDDNEQLSESKIKQFSQIKLIQPNKTIHHISHLRKYENEQKHRQTLLNNRLKFITIGSQKDNKKLQMVKRKLEKVVSIRSQFLKEKETLNKTKSFIERDQMNHKYSKVNYVKQQQNNRKLSVSRLSHGKSLQASRLRDQQKANQKQILSNRLTQLQKKKEAVRHAQSSLEKSRQHISQINRSRISSIRSIQNKTLIRNYVNVEKREKINEKLHQTLQREIKLINQRKLKAASELKEYQNLLGMNAKKSNEINLISKNNRQSLLQSPFNKQQRNTIKLQRAVSSTFSSSGSKSFYLTNY